MILDDSFFVPEEQCKFYVRGMMKRYWAAGLECLHELDRICTNNDITYYVYYGTLLGAVRHKGFIPWDDDIDIIMMRWDYDKLIEHAGELESYFHLINIDVSSLYPMRLINTYYTCMEQDYLERFHNCPYPTGIDIYVLDKTPVDQDDIEALSWLHQNARFVAQRADNRWRQQNPNSVTDQEIENVISQIENATGYTFVRDDTIVSQMTRFTHCISATFNDTNSKNVARIHNWAISGDDENIPIDWFGNPKYLEFCGMKVPVPQQYERILAKTMGDDYMTPKQFYNCHNYPVFKKYEEKLIEIYEKCGQKPPEFLFE